jgi:hypothetical protein
MTRARDPDGGRPATSAWLAGAGAVALVLLALMFGNTPRAASAATPSFTLTPPSQTVAQNVDAVSVEVVLNDAASIAGWSFQLSYNPGVLTFVSAEADTSLLLKTGASDVYCPGVESDQAAGLVQVRCSALGGDKEASGSAKVATIRFKPNAPGRSELLFQRTGLLDRRSNSLAATAAAGVIHVLAPGEVAGGVAPTPALPTPAPTAVRIGTPTAQPSRAPAGTATPPAVVGSSKGTGSGDTQHGAPWLRYLGIASAAIGGVAIAAGIRAWRRRQLPEPQTVGPGAPVSPQASGMVSEANMDQPGDKSEDFFAQIEQRTQQMKATLANLKIGVPASGELPVAPDVRDAAMQHHVELSGAVSDDELAAGFLSLLERRTQQLKTALANLKDDKVRIEALVAKLEPLVPQYDALVSAERSLADAQVDVGQVRPDGADPASGG